MRAPHLAVTVFALAALAMAAGCDDGTTEPNALRGTLRLQLTTPNTDDGAILLEIDGGNLDQVTSLNPSHMMYLRTAGSVVRVVIVGDIVDGELLEWRVPNVGAADSYSARIVEVADRGSDLRSRLTDYDLVITNPND